MSRKAEWNYPIESQQRTDFERKANLVMLKLEAATGSNPNYLLIYRSVISDLLSYIESNGADVFGGNAYFAHSILPGIRANASCPQARACLAGFILARVTNAIASAGLTRFLKQSA